MRDLLRFLKAFKKWCEAGFPTDCERVGDKFVDLNPNNFSKRLGLCANAGRYDRSHIRKNGRQSNAQGQLFDSLAGKFKDTTFPFNETVYDTARGGNRYTYYDDCDHALGVMVNPRRRQFVIDTIAELSAKVKGR